MGMRTAKGIHLITPHLEHLWSLAHDVGGTTQDRLNVLAGGPLDGGWTGADGHVERGVRFLYGLREYPQVVHMGKLPMERQRFLSPRLSEHLRGFTESRAALVHINAKPIKLLALVATANADLHTATAQHIQHGDLFGHQDRIVQRQHHHSRTNTHLLGTGDDRTGKREKS